MPKTTKTTEVPPKKAAQEKCSSCNHPETFHRGGACKVMACSCVGWNGRKGAKKEKKVPKE